MTDKLKMLALFDDIEPAAAGTDTLHDLGLSNHDFEVITGSPINPEMLGRHHAHTNVPRFALGGAIFGLFVVLFEMIMLMMLIFTFLGVFFESVFPSYEKKEYVPEISDGDIAFIFECSPDDQSKFEDALANAGANTVRIIERQQL